MIIGAAARGEDLGPHGALWLAAGRVPPRPAVAAEPLNAPAYIEDPQAYVLMQNLTDRGSRRPRC